MIMLLLALIGSATLLARHRQQKTRAALGRIERRI